MDIGEVIGLVFAVLSQLGVLTIIRAAVVVLVAAAIVDYFVHR